MIVTTILAPSVVLGALAAWMALAALAAFAASLFRFRFSAGVALGGSRASPGIALGVPVANLPLVPVGPDAPRLCDVSLEDVDNLASLSGVRQTDHVCVSFLRNLSLYLYVSHFKTSKWLI